MMFGFYFAVLNCIVLLQLICRGGTCRYIRAYVPGMMEVLFLVTHDECSGLLTSIMRRGLTRSGLQRRVRCRLVARSSYYVRTVLYSIDISTLEYVRGFVFGLPE